MWAGCENMKIYCPKCSKETGNTLSRNKHNGKVICKKCGIGFQLTLTRYEKVFTKEEIELSLLHNNPKMINKLEELV